MKYNSKNHNKNGSNLLYLLSFIDSIDRLDTMVLEIRHLQANIIYNLRESDLFSILNYEEKYIWDTDLESIIREKNEIDTIKEKNIFYTKTIIKWIPSFPSFYDKTNQHNKSDLTKKIRRLIKNIRNKSLWSDDQQTMYHSLISLQQLKRDIVLDKINLCTFAFNANLHTTNNDTDRYIKSKFMVVRAAIMSKVSDDYVDRLFEYRQQMEFIADLSSEAMPQSSIKRRREIELYSNFLAERTRTMRTDFSLLLNEIGFNHTHNDDYLILHNWHHKYVSQSRSYKIPYDDIRPNYSTHIGSHFWTPERPDLQPIIAHEVAHIFINSELDNLKSYKLQTLSDDLSCLLIDMKKIISSYIEKAIDKDVQLGIGYEDSTTITREIACDILASSVKGQSFLYAHFLENLGFHYSFSSLVQNYDGDDIEPGLIHSARYSVENNYYHTKEWYLRSLVLISWVNNTWYKNNKNNLDNDLINGIDLIINNLMDYYTEISISEKDKYAISIWKDMTNDICKCIGSHSNLTKKIKKFRIEKEKTEYSYTSEKKFPLRAKRIDFRVRNSLYKMQMWMKSQGSRPLSKLKNNLDDDKMNDIFNDFYIGKDETQSIIENDEFETPPLYKYIYDIPWQSSLMRAKDMYWTIDAKEKISRKNNNFNNFLFEITNEFPLGRDLFSYEL